MGYGRENEHVVIRTDYPEITSQLAQNAQQASNFKTALNTWDTAIQNAINATTNGKVLLPTGQEISVAGKITLKANVILDLNGSVIKPTGNFDVIQVVKDSKLINGIIDAKGVAGYSSSAIYLGGTEDFSVNHNTFIDNIKVIGVLGTNGNAIKLHASGTSTSASVCFVKFGKIHVDGFDKGIYLKTEVPNAGKVNYVNGNTFNQITFNNCANPIYIDGNKATPDEITGNNFRQIQIQPTTVTQQQIYISGAYNNIELFPWDAHVQTTNIVVTFNDKSVYCRVEAPYAHGDRRIVDNGAGNKVISTSVISDTKSGDVIVPDFVYNLPNSVLLKSFGGNQDDFLVNASERYTVTSSIAPSFGVVSSIFKLPTAQTAQWNDTNKPTEANPLVITVNFNTNITYVGTIGIVASFGQFGDYTKVEAYDVNAAQWVTVIEKKKGVNPKGNGNFLVGFANITTINQLRVTMYDFVGASTKIEIERLFLQCASNGQAWIPTNGGTVYGDMRFTWWDGTGPILKDRSNGLSYRLKVTGGVLGVEQV